MRFGVIEMTRSGNKIAYKQILLFWVCLLLVAACQNAPAAPPSLPPTALPIAFVPLDVLLKSNIVSAAGETTTAGYLIADSTGVSLVDGLSFADDGTPHLLDNPNQIWLGAGLAP